MGMNYAHYPKNIEGAEGQMIAKKAPNPTDKHVGARVRVAADEVTEVRGRDGLERAVGRRREHKRAVDQVTARRARGLSKRKAPALSRSMLVPSSKGALASSTVMRTPASSKTASAGPGSATK